MSCLLKFMIISAALAIPASALDAQTHRPTRVPVTIVLADRVEGDAPFVLVRRTDVSPRDVILLRTGADARTLSDAVRALITARSIAGDTATQAAVLRVRPSGGARGRPILPWAPRVLADLQRAERRAVAALGHVRAVEVWLPARRSRAPTPR